jgi:hypothetical protein
MQNGNGSRKNGEREAENNGDSERGTKNQDLRNPRERGAKNRDRGNLAGIPPCEQHSKREK